MAKWLTCLFAIIGGFFSCGIGGAFIASYFGFWELPAAGFCAAFAVVALTYVSAPSHNEAASVLSFIVGLITACYILQPSFYPESYEQHSYQGTYIPFISTLLGGLFVLAVIFLGRLKRIKTA